MNRYRLRSTRANPPGLAASDLDRRATFSAALQQSEDLFDAAAAVGPVTRPLPLFYAISQAGRAIAAAHIAGEWRVSGHGLTEDRERDEWKSGDIADFRVRPLTKRGAFGAVAETFGVPGLTDSVELGALWSAVPGASLPDGNRWLSALPVWPELYVQGRGFALHLGAAHRGYVALREGTPSDHPNAINELLAKYPAAAGAQVEAAQGIIATHATPWGFGVPVRWPAPNIELRPEGPPPPEYLASQVHSRVPQYRFQREHWLIPFVGDGRDKLPAVLVWWVLLFSLSLLARYEPAAWRAALDPDASVLAVPLERLLDEALDVLPQLLYEAVTSEPALLPPRS